jgi:serine/threonine protein kinase
MILNQGNLVVISFRLAPHGDLLSVAEAKKLTDGNIADAGTQLYSALGRLHAVMYRGKMLIHCDIKGENLLVMRLHPFLVIQICDIGCAGWE